MDALHLAAGAVGMVEVIAGARVEAMEEEVAGAMGLVIARVATATAISPTATVVMGTPKVSPDSQ